MPIFCHLKRILFFQAQRTFLSFVEPFEFVYIASACRHDLNPDGDLSLLRETFEALSRLKLRERDHPEPRKLGIFGLKR
jgi:hypothetical protein